MYVTKSVNFILENTHIFVHSGLRMQKLNESSTKNIVDNYLPCTITPNRTHSNEKYDLKSDSCEAMRDVSYSGSKTTCIPGIW